MCYQFLLPLNEIQVFSNFVSDCIPICYNIHVFCLLALASLPSSSFFQLYP